jgi:hypothetical protein
LIVKVQFVVLPRHGGGELGPPPVLYHTPNDDPVAGVGVSVTVVPAVKSYEHVPGQWIPAGLDVTLPDPVPFTVMVSLYVVSLAAAPPARAAALVGTSARARGATIRTMWARRSPVTAAS